MIRCVRQRLPRRKNPGHPDHESERMKKLTILRHAKSDWTSTGIRDFDRPLNLRGEKGAGLMGGYLRDKGYRFDHVVASPALRCAETVELMEKALGRPLHVAWDRRIYLASSVTLIDVLREVKDDPGHVLICGHNPGLEDLIFDLVPDDGSSPLRREIEIKFPTCALVDLECDINDWDSLDNRCAKLINLVRPRDLDPELGPEMDSF